jgi:uncharacterized protein YcaQ
VAAPDARAGDGFAIHRAFRPDRAAARGGDDERVFAPIVRGASSAARRFERIAFSVRIMPTMPATQFSLTDARRLAVRCQHLDGRGPLPPGKEGAARAIERLGYVQIDTIAVVHRAHHHTLWARCPDYDPRMLHDLQAVERRVFEYWAHAIAYLPISDYRYFVPRMNRIREQGTTWMRGWREKHRDVIDGVLDRIRAEGALTSKDFEPTPGVKRGTWWDWKPAKRALELLFWQGDLMIAERRNFQKVYDLTERILPGNVDASPPAEQECGRFQVRRALQALGVAKDREIFEFIKVADRPIVRQALADLVEIGDVVPVEVEGTKGRTCYALAERLEASPEEPLGPRVQVLSPFDGLVIHRPRTEWLFGFEYTLECYLPEAKRRYGYYVMPILYGDRLVGRLDPKADREERTLIVRKLWLESRFEATDEFLARLAVALVRFADFNGCDVVKVGWVSPAKLRGPVSRHVRAAFAANDTRRP